MTTSDQSSFARRLAARVIALSRRPLPPAATRNALTCIADTVSVAIAGATEPCTDILRRTPGVGEAPGRSLVWAGTQRTSALDAALINGTASHALDYDDLCAVFGGHHSAPLVAPLFALADERGATGPALLSAYAAGVETEVRLARALLPEHYDKGWHPTSTLGVVGTAAALSCLIGLDEARTATALSIAVSMASGLKANFGSMTKPLHVGQCGRAGLFAALLAERGFDAGRQAFEGGQGFFEVYNGSGRYRAELALQGWGEPFEIEGETIGIKQFPCCGSTHAAITAALEIVQGRPLDPADIERIDILPNANRLVHTDKPDPRTALDGKFSVQYVVARALLSGSVGLDHFSEAAVGEPAIRDLLAKVEARPHPDMPRTGENLWGAEVRITLRSGELLSRRIENLSCRDGSYPMGEQESWRKFEDCALVHLPAAQVRALYDALLDLPACGDVRRVSGLMQGSRPPP